VHDDDDNDDEQEEEEDERVWVVPFFGKGTCCSVLYGLIGVYFRFGP
jgi:hypothetical protein